MDKEMLRRAEEALDKKQMRMLMEDAELQAMTGYRLTIEIISELERLYPREMREIEQYSFRELLLRKQR